MNLDADMSHLLRMGMGRSHKRRWRTCLLRCVRLLRRLRWIT